MKKPYLTTLTWNNPAGDVHVRAAIVIAASGVEAGRIAKEMVLKSDGQSMDLYNLQAFSDLVPVAQVQAIARCLPNYEQGE